ncbi:hypothetical protein VU04_06105 [Desulfobulbus sp. TB]|nr:hypothetical protein [Desulfobulbus sp. TB]
MIIPPAGDNIVPTGLDADVIVNFVDGSSYDLFVASLLSYDRSMLEVCDFSTVGQG